MEDDHVDRPGVEVRQRMELTGTNRSIGLIALISRCSSTPNTRRDARDRIHLLHLLPFAGLVAFAKRQDPIPSRTRPSNASAPMVLCLKTWESRSLPGLPRAEEFLFKMLLISGSRRGSRFVFGAGWSSPVARQAHNLKVTGSNPVPATRRPFDLKGIF